MSKISVVFAGSFLEYSRQVLSGLLGSSELEIKGVITTPPLLNKKGQLDYNPVHQLGLAHQLPVVCPDVLNTESLEEMTGVFGRVEILLTAGYGKLLPTEWLQRPQLAALNLRFSLLPKYRGANPAEWSILLNEKESGVTLIEMSPEFDTGTMIAQAACPITANETRETLYTKLYDLGARTLPKMISEYVAFKSGQALTELESNSELTIHFFLPPQPQGKSATPYAARLRRDDGCIAWSSIWACMRGEVATPTDFSSTIQKILEVGGLKADAAFVERAIRALSGFPSPWSIVETTEGPKRMKLLSASVELNSQGKKVLKLDQVHIEGKSPARWSEVKNNLTQIS